MDLEALLRITVVLLPLVVTPGPANLANFAIGCAGNVKRGLAFTAGLNLAVLIWSLVFFFGGSALVSQPWFPLLGLQIAGVLYIAYLGYSLLRSPAVSAADNLDNIPGFQGGFVLQMLNPKLFVLLLVVLSQIPVMSVGWMSLFILYFILLNLLPHVGYLLLGLWGASLGSLQFRNRLSGVLLILVAGWISLELL